jgi:hypothetical protein
MTAHHAVSYAINVLTNYMLSTFPKSEIADVAMKEILVATSDKLKVHIACN